MTTSETTEICSMATRILQRTRDGDNLHPTDLYLVQCAINDCLNKTGAEEFRKLHQIVADGTYNIDERDRMNPKTALGIIKTEFAKHGKETTASTRAYVENRIGVAAYMEARRAGLRAYREAQNDV